MPDSHKTYYGISIGDANEPWRWLSPLINKGPIDAPLLEATMFRTIILGLATVATIAAVTVAAAVIGTAAATYAIDKAALTVTTATPAATPQWPARYVGRFVGLS
jgi:hypothetical protein